MTHTPGPWTARKQSNKHHADLGWIIEFYNGRIGWSSLAYADVNKEAEKDDPAREANARLIASAPKLLEALGGAFEALAIIAATADEQLVREVAAEASAKIEAAIAKATGADHAPK